MILERPTLRGLQAVELVEDIATADFQAAMVFVHGFVELMRRFLGGGLGGVKGISNGIGQFGLIVLYRKDVIGAAIPNGLGNVRLGTHGIDGDDAPFQDQRGQEFWDGRFFVGLFGRSAALSQHQLRTCGKCADQVQRCFANRPGTPTRFAVDGHHFAFGQRRHNMFDPALEGRAKRCRIHCREDSAKGVVRRNPVLQLQMAPEPFQIVPRPVLDLDEGVGADQYATNSNDQQFQQVVIHRPLLSWVSNPDKYVPQLQLAFRLHSAPKKTENYTNHAVVNSPFAIL